jgi:hypothetical protein
MNTKISDWTTEFQPTKLALVSGFATEFICLAQAQADEPATPGGKSATVGKMLAIARSTL